MCIVCFVKSPKLLHRLANINHATRRAIAGAREAISETPGAPRRCVI